MSEVAEEKISTTINIFDMTLTNKDHLDWHKKKHEMMLNLELLNKNNESADQTPTPTRFIRNCEEVGLFQDLQHVNPFEETFKKAVDSAKNGSSLEVPEANNSSDTLHTPHILPHVEDNQKKTNQVTSQAHPYEFTINVPQTIIISECLTKIDVKAIKKKISENIQKKQLKSKEENFISCVPLEDLTEKKNGSIIVLDSGEENESKSEKKKKIREMNRAAQGRCRKRKQLLWKQMQEEIHSLKEENKKLKFENVHLKKQITQYLKESITTEEAVEGVTTNNRKTQDNALHIQKLGPTQLTLCSTNTNLTIANQQSDENASITIGQEKKVKTKVFRKIVPKIIINK